MVDVALDGRWVKSIAQRLEKNVFHLLQVFFVELSLAELGEALHGDVLGAEQLRGKEERCDGSKLEGRAIAGAQMEESVQIVEGDGYDLPVPVEVIDDSIRPQGHLFTTCNVDGRALL